LKLVVVTGTNKGLGKALVDVLLENEDVHLLTFSRSKAVSNSKRTHCVINMGKTVDFERKVPWDLLPIIDSVIFINNAATIVPIEKTVYLSKAQIDLAYTLNVFSPLAIIKELVRRYRLVHVIHVGTGAANNPIAHLGIYCATKGAVEMHLKVMHQEEDILLDVVDPGVIDTEMQQVVRSSIFPSQKYFMELYNQEKLRSPNQVAEEIVEGFLST